MNIVYTAIFGNYDDLSPLNFNSDIKYLCFTDNESLFVKGWDIKHVNLNELSPRDRNREIKFKPHQYIPDATSSFYVDGNITIKKDLSPLFDKYLNRSDMAIPNHRIRSCLYEEAEACLKAGIIVDSDIHLQLDKYRREGFPQSYGLSENGIIFRKNIKKINDLMDAWWFEYMNGVKRDQISLPYLMWKMNINVCAMEETAFNHNDYFQYRIHKNYKRSGLRGKISDYMLERKYKFKVLLAISKMLIFFKNIK